MQCLTAENLSRYRGGSLDSSDELRETERHLAECISCRALLRLEVASAAPRLAHSLLPDADAGSCLDEETLRRCADGTADASDQEIAGTHLAFCPNCREDIESLREFQQEMQGYDWTRLRSTSWRERIADEGFGLRQWLRTALKRLWAWWNRGSLSVRITGALLLGLLTGLLLGHRAAVLQPVSEGILHLLGAIAAPLIFLALLHTLMRAKVKWDVFGRLAVLLLTNAAVAVGIGISAATMLHLGSGAALHSALLTEPQAAGTLPPAPSSLFAPLVENNLLFVILLALGLGMALREVRQDELKAGTTAFRAAEDSLEVAYRCLMRLLQWVIALVPLAVFAAAASVIGTYGGRPLPALLGFTAAVPFALLLLAGYYLLRVRLHSHIAPLRLLRETRSTLLTAFSTASSAAAMPLTYARVTERLGIREEAASLGVLVGGNISRDGTALFEAMGVLFIAQAMGAPLSLPQIVLVGFMAVLASVCAPGIPAAGLVTMTLVFQSLHLPLAANYIVLLIPLDSFLDRCRTAVSVLGHISVACLLDGKPAENRQD